MKDDTLRNAFEQWEALSGTKEDVTAYKARMKKLFDEQSMIIEAEMREIEKGKTQTLVEAVLQLLTVKRGRIPRKIEDLIQHADGSTLKALVENIFTFSEIDEVKKYL